jgi:5-methylcytosine-specific restriction endonuclease McrA
VVVSVSWGQQSNRIVPTDWNSRKRACFAAYGDTCHLCQHAGADQVDHVINVARGGTHELQNLRPVHGGACPTCQRRCHTDKTTRESHAYRPKRRREPEPHPGLLPAPPQGGYPHPAHHGPPLRIAPAGLYGLQTR